MKIRTDKAMSAVDAGTLQQLAVFLGFARTAGYHWEGKDYLPELAARRLIDKRPELQRRLVESDEIAGAA